MEPIGIKIGNGAFKGVVIVNEAMIKFRRRE